MGGPSETRFFTRLVTVNVKYQERCLDGEIINELARFHAGWVSKCTSWVGMTHARYI
jgi:hypothetical protein